MRILAAILILSSLGLAQGIGGKAGMGGTGAFGGGASGGGGGGTFTLSNTVADRATYANKLNCTTTTCTLTVPAITSGHAATIHIVDSGGNGQILSAVSSTGATWVVPVGCKVSSGPVGDLATAYTLSLGSGTTITLTLTQNFADTVVIYHEYAYSGSTVSFDACFTQTNGTSTTSAPGPTLTLAGGNEIVSQQLGMSATPASISAASPYDTNLVKTNDTAASLAFAAGSTVLNTPPTTASAYTLGTAEFSLVNALVLKGN